MILACLMVGILSLTALVYPYFKKCIRIKSWYSSLDLYKHQNIYLNLFEGINGFALSLQARKAKDAIEYTYGEIEFISFIALLSLAKPDKKTIFYDLGSGIGKAAIGCALVFDVQKSCGVELLEILHLVALGRREQLFNIRDYSDIANKIHFINDDFLNIDFSDATIVFINATAFFGETWLTIQKRLKQLKAGTFIITTSKKLPSDLAFLIKTTHVQMSWGPVITYIQQRIGS